MSRRRVDRALALTVISPGPHPCPFWQRPVPAGSPAPPRGLPLANTGTALAWAPSILIIVLIGALLVRPQWTVRMPSSRQGDGKVAAIITVNERPGDAVFYIPSRLRAIKYPYTAVWGRLRDIALARSPAASASLAGTQVSPALLAQRFTKVDRVWLITWRRAYLSRTSQAELRLVGTMHLIGQWRVHSTVLRLYSKAANGSPGTAPRRASECQVAL
jgi:hypothetical protein